MKLNERFKNFPVKFYQNLETGRYEYESGFTTGQANSLNDALMSFDDEEFIHDLYYYYNDVMDVQVGRFIPALEDKIRKGRKYLGKLEIKLDINPTTTDPIHTVSYLNKNRQDIPKHLEYIQKLKRGEKIDNLKNKIHTGIKRILNTLSFREFFSPEKALEQKICSHCGQIIPIGTYYEIYRKKDYHIECIWDKLVNNKEENDFKEAEKYFFSLQKFINRWPAYGYDVEEDYIDDLELVKTNNRYTKHTPLKEDLKRINQMLEYYQKGN